MDVLLNSLEKYYFNEKNLNSLVEVLENNNKISLRIIDWFVTNYSKKNNIYYTIFRNKEGIYSYKSQYGDFFTAAGHYHTIAKKSFSHSSEYFSADANERVALTLLHKEEDPYPEL